MAEDHMSHDAFFDGLTELFNDRKEKDHGSVYLTQKRFSYVDGVLKGSTPTVTREEGQFSDLNPPHPLPIIVRATNGKGKKATTKKIKLSTIVQPDDIEAFFLRYSEICKAGMKNLKKRDRKARKKDKAKKKKATTEGEVKS